jgi:hypothetical protein
LLLAPGGSEDPSQRTSESESEGPEPPGGTGVEPAVRFAGKATFCFKLQRIKCTQHGPGPRKFGPPRDTLCDSASRLPRRRRAAAPSPLNDANLRLLLLLLLLPPPPPPPPLPRRRRRHRRRRFWHGAVSAMRPTTAGAARRPARAHTSPSPSPARPPCQPPSPSAPATPCISPRLCS